MNHASIFDHLQSSASGSWQIDPTLSTHIRNDAEAMQHEETGLDQQTTVQRPSLVELKRTYLSRLPVARLVSTILDLEMRGTRSDPTFGSNIWPPDLEAAVRSMEPVPSPNLEQERIREAERERQWRAQMAKDRQRREVREKDRDKETFHPGTNGLPNYEEMICEALYDIGEEDGCPPKIIFDWIAERYPINTNFRPSAHQAIQKSHKRGRLEKTGNKYRLNPDWDGSTAMTKKPTRKPKAATEPSPAPPPPPPPPVPLQTPSMSIEAALSLLVNNAPQPRPPPIPAYNPPSAVQASLNSLAQQFAARGRKRRADDLDL